MGFYFIVKWFHKGSYLKDDGYIKPSEDVVHCAQGGFKKIRLFLPLICGEFNRAENSFLDDPTAMWWMKALTFLCFFS